MSDKNRPVPDDAFLDPAGTFVHPRQVLEHAELDREQKVEILRRWQYDASELAVATDEGMGGGEPNQLDAVLEALAALGEEPVPDEAPIKQGGGV